LVQNCVESGVLGVVPGLIGVIQAAETIKLITGIGETLVGRLLLVDALRMRFRTIDLAKDPECVACGQREITALIDYEAFCGMGQEDAEHPTDAADEITPTALAARLQQGDAPVLLDVREPHEWAIVRLPEARLVPLNSLPDALDTLNRSEEIVVYCHHGLRSAAAVDWLREQGFDRARNLVGGIDRWTRDVDPSMRRY
jgi:adenylyltransferase/sulfurtransferase